MFLTIDMVTLIPNKFNIQLQKKKKKKKEPIDHSLSRI